MKTFGTFLACGAAGAVLLLAPASADPLMGSNSWSPKPNANRASIASLMLQQKAMRNPAPSYAGAVFTCGGSGGGGSGGTGGAGDSAGGSGGAGGNTTSSSATANNNCVIVVGSKGTVVDPDQVSNGNQSSGAESNDTVNSASLSSILESME